MKLQTKGTPSRVPAWVHIKRRKRSKRGHVFWEVVHAKGHLDEVQALSKHSRARPPPPAPPFAALCATASTREALEPACRLGARDVAGAHRGQGPRRGRLLAREQSHRGESHARVRAQAHAQGHRAPVPRARILRAGHHAQHRTPVLHPPGACAPGPAALPRMPSAVDNRSVQLSPHDAAPSVPGRSVNDMCCNLCKVCSTHRSRTSTTCTSSSTSCPAATSWTSSSQRRASSSTAPPTRPCTWRASRPRPKFSRRAASLSRQTRLRGRWTRAQCRRCFGSRQHLRQACAGHGREPRAVLRCVHHSRA